MTVTLYNTLSQTKEIFQPLQEGVVSMYVCGPTVYDYAHLGHGRSMVAFDVIRKYLEYRGYAVQFITNYTDIDDKMIERAAEEGRTVAELAKIFTAKYDEDYGRLGIATPTLRPWATDYVDSMIAMIHQLLDKGFAYELEDGIYFDVSTFKDYGKLSKQDLDALEMGARVAVDASKRNPQDFALWKNKKQGEPSWSDAQGIIKEGRPGWHIECSAMVWKAIGTQCDIHGGGADLMFPHHECEVAQSEACFGSQFARYWLHNGFVRVNGEKMSKSLGNFTTLRDLFEQYDSLVIRYALMSVHYRGPIEFTPDFLVQATASVQRLRSFVARVQLVTDAGEASDEVKHAVKQAEQNFITAMDDDFEISKGLAAIYALVTTINKQIDSGNFTHADAATVLDFMQRIDRILSLELFAEKAALPQEIQELLTQREVARSAKDWETADRLRDQILAAGYMVKDGLEGQTVTSA